MAVRNRPQRVPEIAFGEGDALQPLVDSGEYLAVIGVGESMGRI